VIHLGVLYFNAKINKKLTENEKFKKIQTCVRSAGENPGTCCLRRLNQTHSQDLKIKKIIFIDLFIFRAITPSNNWKTFPFFC
jgi:hypothetical protein